jgi:hypothetical protein
MELELHILLQISYVGEIPSCILAITNSGHQLTKPMCGIWVQQDYLFLGGVLFIFAFIGMEMAKPSKESHFEPEMYQDK